MEETRVCTKCLLEKPIRYFEFRSDTKKFRNYCKKCNKGYFTTREEKIDIIQSLLEDGLKLCSYCGELKSVNDFYRDKYTITRLSSSCKLCSKEKSLKNSGKSRKYNIKKRYNASDNDINDFISKNNCEICGCELNKKNKHFDHNHLTGTYRGALCMKCNLGIGYFDDNEKKLKNAIKYIKKHLTNTQ